jgi:regulator of replication initiation timing
MKKAQKLLKECERKLGIANNTVCDLMKINANLERSSHKTWGLKETINNLTEENAELDISNGVLIDKNQELECEIFAKNIEIDSLREWIELLLKAED